MVLQGDDGERNHHCFETPLPVLRAGIKTPATSSPATCGGMLLDCCKEMVEMKDAGMGWDRVCHFPSRMGRCEEPLLRRRAFCR